MNDLSLNSHIEEQIADQLAREGGPKHKPVPPLEAPVIAKRHTPVYQMHRYFARRPWNVFEHIIKHYTNAGDLILDPFCGGGVTVYEGLKLRRRVIGVDLNPLAAWITRMQVKQFDLDEVEKAFNQAVDEFNPVEEELYSTACEDCGKKSAAEWFEWSNTVICPGCGEKVVLAEAKKLRGGTYECPNEKCLGHFAVKDCERREDALVNKMVNCPDCGKMVRKASPEDIQKAEYYRENARKIIAEEGLFVPDVPFPDGDRARDDAIFAKGVKNFSDLFTPRNLLALAKLKKIIAGLKVDDEIREALWFIFSDTLRFSNSMMSRNPSWRGNNPEWPGHAYWMPNIFVETDNLKYFYKRLKSFIKGKGISQNELNDFSLGFPHLNFTYQVVAQSSEIPFLAYKSIDCIITDPPFGGNVQYAELSDFWVVWLPEVFGIEGIIDNTLEAIETRHQGFPTAKNREHYEETLYRVFKECHRVLKDDGYMALTFHNRDAGVWMALHRAARRAGFALPVRDEVKNHGMIYQDFIENFKHTFHTRAPGSLLGDFILTFKKVEIPSQIENVISDLSTSHQEAIIDRIGKAIRFHGGLDNTSIGNLVVETLIDLNLLHRFEGSDLSRIYKPYLVYVKKEKKWYTPDMVDPENRPLKIYDVYPVERVVESMLYSFLKEKQCAPLDDVLFFIFTKMVNSERPGIDVVKKVLNRCCKTTRIAGYKREVYFWKESLPQPGKVDELKKNQIDIFTGDIEDHNSVIKSLALKFTGEGYDVHIGDTETRKDKELREISSDLDAFNLGVSRESYSVLKEIDLLILRGGNIQKAIEVVTTFSTFNKAINDRFRNLITTVPNLKFDVEVYLLKNDMDKAVKELNSPANVKDGLIRIVKLKVIGSD